MVLFAKKLGYKYIKVKGSGGAHASDNQHIFEIHIGKNQSLEDMVVTFAHELGHAIDYAYSPIGVLEKYRRMKGHVDLQAISREVAAWGHGERILKDMGCFKHVEDKFRYLRERGLNSYTAALRKES